MVFALMKKFISKMVWLQMMKLNAQCQGIFNIKTGAVIQDPPCDALKTYEVKVEDDKIYLKI